MSDAEDFATLFAREAARPTLEVGQIVKGRVIQIAAESVFVDVGGKGEAWIERAELTDDEGRLRVAVGGEVAAVIKGGYEETVGGLRAFCPFSQMHVQRVEAAEEYVGRVLEFRVVTYSDNGRNLVLSRRRLLEERAAETAEETRKKILPGAVLTGTVASLTDFGAFVDLGGVQGLVPLSELSHSRVSRPADRLRVGEAVTVKVLRVDQEKGRISLSLKALEGDPWAAVPGRLRERQVVQGRAVRATEFGVFVELLPGVDGLLHNTEIPRSRQGAIREAAAGGAEVTVMIVSVDPEKRRVALALAPEGAASGQEMESRVEVGAVLTGTVARLESFGVFVRLGPGQTGLIPIGELGTARGTDLRKAFPVGTEIRVLVLAIEEGGRRIRLSHAQALGREERAETQAYLRETAKQGDGFRLTLGERMKQVPRNRS